MHFLLNWLVSTLAIIITVYLLPGVALNSLAVALVVALVLGIINALVRPVLLILTLPINVLTLGFFTFVINGFLVMLAAAIVPGFSVANFWWAFLFSIVLSIINFFLGQIKRSSVY